jgi:hypothetical protein
MPNNPILDLAFAGMLAWFAYVIGRMLLRREAPVRDGWTKWTWQSASVFPGSFVWGLFMSLLLLVVSAVGIYADFTGWLR